MGNTNSRPPSLHILKIRPNTPAHKSNLLPFIHTITAINSQPATADLLHSLPTLWATTELNLTIYDLRTEKESLVTIPRRSDVNYICTTNDNIKQSYTNVDKNNEEKRDIDNSEQPVNEEAKFKSANKQSLGLSVSLTSTPVLLSLAILETIPNSPAFTAGLIPHQDFIIGIEGTTIRDEDDFFNFLYRNVSKEVTLLVVNVGMMNLRRAIVVPERDQLLGAEFACGRLYELPVGDLFFDFEMCTTRKGFGTGEEKIAIERSEIKETITKDVVVEDQCTGKKEELHENNSKEEVKNANNVEEVNLKEEKIFNEQTREMNIEESDKQVVVNTDSKKVNIESTEKVEEKNLQVYDKFQVNNTNLTLGFEADFTSHKDLNFKNACHTEKINKITIEEKRGEEIVEKIKSDTFKESIENRECFEEIVSNLDTSITNIRIEDNSDIKKNINNMQNVQEDKIAKDLINLQAKKEQETNESAVLRGKTNSANQPEMQELNFTIINTNENPSNVVNENITNDTFNNTTNFIGNDDNNNKLNNTFGTTKNNKTCDTNKSHDQDNNSQNKNLQERINIVNETISEKNNVIENCITGNYKELNKVEFNDTENNHVNNVSKNNIVSSKINNDKIISSIKNINTDEFNNYVESKIDNKIDQCIDENSVNLEIRSKNKKIMDLFGYGIRKKKICDKKINNENVKDINNQNNFKISKENNINEIVNKETNKDFNFCEIKKEICDIEISNNINNINVDNKLNDGNKKVNTEIFNILNQGEDEFNLGECLEEENKGYLKDDVVLGECIRKENKGYLKDEIVLGECLEEENKLNINNSCEIKLSKINLKTETCFSDEGPESENVYVEETPTQSDPGVEDIDKINDLPEHLF